LGRPKTNTAEFLHRKLPGKRGAEQKKREEGSKNQGKSRQKKFNDQEKVFKKRPGKKEGGSVKINKGGVNTTVSSCGEDERRWGGEKKVGGEKEKNHPNTSMNEKAERGEDHLHVERTKFQSGGKRQENQKKCYQQKEVTFENKGKNGTGDKK